MHKINQLGVTKDELAEIIKNCTRQDICVHFGVSARTLDRILHDYQLVRSNYGPKKLSIEIIETIRNLYSSKAYTQNELASIYCISQSLVSKIINNQVHRNCHHLSVSGNAEIKIGYKYGNQG